MDQAGCPPAAVTGVNAGVPPSAGTDCADGPLPVLRSQMPPRPRVEVPHQASGLTGLDRAFANISDA